MYYFADFRAPWVICQSQTHTTTPMNQDGEILSISIKIEVRGMSTRLILTDRPEIGKNPIHTCTFMQTSRLPTEPTPVNRRIFTEIIEIHRIRTSYESGSDRSSRNRLNTQAHVFCKAPRCSFTISVRNDEKSGTATSKMHTPVAFEPPT